MSNHYSADGRPHEWLSSAGFILARYAVVGVSSLACILWIGCASDGKRDPAVDKRLFEGIAASQPSVVAEQSAEVGVPPIGIWLREFDSTDSRVFSRALDGVRANSRWLPVALANPGTHPSSINGRRALIEILTAMLHGGDAPPALLRGAESIFKKFAARDPDLSEPEPAAEVSIRLAAVEGLGLLTNAELASFFAEKLFDSARVIRWTAADYFRRHPTRMTHATLTALVAQLRAPDDPLAKDGPVRRADALQLLAHFEGLLAIRVPGSTGGRMTFDPYASDRVRERQVAPWLRWLGSADAALARIRAASDGSAEGE